MRKFQFPLESALRLRSLQLKIERDKWAAARAEVARLEQAGEALAAECAAARAFVESGSDAGSNDLHSLAAYLLGHAARRAELEDKLKAARLHAEEQRRRTVAADREERLLLKLKARQRAVWQAAADHEVEILAQESWNAVHFGRR